MSIDVRKLRESLQLTQDEFASRFGINIGTLRDWEHRRYEPTGPARTLLMVISRRPDVVQEVIRTA